jgi:hypothetical protein
MSRVKRGLSYANIVATLALFLAVSGGAVYAASNLGKNAVKSGNIAKGAVKTKNLAANAVSTAKIRKNAVTGAKIKKGAVNRSKLATNTLAGLQVAEIQAASVPGLGSEVPGGTPVPITGTATFTPAAGKSYELLTELKGVPVDANGPGGEVCFANVAVLANGVPIGFAGIFANASGTPPFNFEPIGSSSVAIGLQQASQPQTLSVLAFGSTGCGATTSGSLRAVVVQFG